MRVLIFILMVMPFISWSQETKSETLVHDGLDRVYSMYIPADYDGITPIPLLFNFHGFGSNASEQQFYGDFKPIANEENFIIIHPEGLLFNENAHWNVGGFTTGSTVDDVGFTAAMIEKISAEYAIDENRIYSTGMSNGGYMSYLLACQMSDKIAAIASVTGSMTPQTYDQCNAQRSIPMLQIHGTQDGTVPYDGEIWTRSIDDVMAFWAQHNMCSLTPAISDVPDINTTDGTTVEHYVYEDCTDNIGVEHYKVLGGDHTWPGAPLAFPGTNYDIDASRVIWEFLSQYDLNGKRESTPTEELTTLQTEIQVYPNPTHSQVSLTGLSKGNSAYQVISVDGRVLLTGTTQNATIDLSLLSPNLYFIQVNDTVLKVLKIE